MIVREATKWYFLLPISSGVILGLLFFFPNFWPVVFVAFVPLILFLEKHASTPTKIFLAVGAAAGTMVLIGLIALWPSARFEAFVLENVLSGAPSRMRSSIAIDFGFALFLGFLLFWFLVPYLVVLGGGYVLFRRRVSLLPQRSIFEFFLIPGLWVLSEFMRAMFSTGFTFGHVGYRAIDFLPLAITSRVWGIYGLGFVIVLMNQVIARVIAKDSLKQALKVSTALFVIMIAGFLVSNQEMRRGWEGQLLRASAKHGISIGNVVGGGLFLPPDYAALLETLETGKDLVLLPNTVGEPLVGTKDQKDILKAQLFFSDFLERKGARVIITGHDFVESGRRYNAMIAWSRDKMEDIYKKRILFPFGEYFPVVENLFPQAFSQIKRYSPGASANGVMKTPLGDFGMTNCQEVNMPALFREDVRAGAQLLLNGGSEWQFGKAVREEQLRIARMRALETKRFSIRAMKEGVSAIINPLGQVVERSSPDQNLALVTGKAKLLDDITLYVRWGDAAVLATIFIAFLVLVRFTYPHRLF
jgi:apolipoprotein N-acyltransferase